MEKNNSNNGGCAYGKVNRNMIDNLTEDFKDFRTEMRRGVVEIKDGQRELFNHQSNRLPLWTTILFTIGGSLITGLLIWAVTR